MAMTRKKVSDREAYRRKREAQKRWLENRTEEQKMRDHISKLRYREKLKQLKGVKPRVKNSRKNNEENANGNPMQVQVQMPHLTPEELENMEEERRRRRLEAKARYRAKMTDDQRERQREYQARYRARKALERGYIPKPIKIRQPVEEITDEEQRQRHLEQQARYRATMTEEQRQRQREHQARYRARKALEKILLQRVEEERREEERRYKLLEAKAKYRASMTEEQRERQREAQARYRERRTDEQKARQREHAARYRASRKILPVLSQPVVELVECEQELEMSATCDSFVSNTTEPDVASILSMAKRRRGRPPKIPFLDEEAVRLKEEGRLPPKYDKYVEVLTSDSPPISNKSRGRPPKVSHTEANEANGNITENHSLNQEPVKRPRGRPRKVVQQNPMEMLPSLPRKLFDFTVNGIIHGNMPHNGTSTTEQNGDSNHFSDSVGKLVTESPESYVVPQDLSRKLAQNGYLNSTQTFSINMLRRLDMDSPASPDDPQDLSHKLSDGNSDFYYGENMSHLSLPHKLSI